MILMMMVTMTTTGPAAIVMALMIIEDSQLGRKNEFCDNVFCMIGSKKDVISRTHLINRATRYLVS